MPRIVVFLVAFLLCSPAPAQVPMTGAGTGAPVGGGGGGYTGPGDLGLGTIKAWWGLRAYSAATAGTKAIRLCDHNGANCADISTSASTGKLNNPGTLGADNCGVLTTCQVAKLYDQSGALFCGGVACDLSSPGPNPTLNFSCVSSLPCVALVSSSNEQFNGTAFAALSQPSTLVGVANSTNTGAQQSLLILGGTMQLGYRNSANNQVFDYAGTVITATASDGSYHALASVENGASSNLCVDGSSNPGNAGTNGVTSGGQTFSLASSGGGQFFNGTFLEAGVWNSGFSGANCSSLSSNQHTFWGF